jgi:hypothetical protein
MAFLALNRGIMVERFVTGKPANQLPNMGPVGPRWQE